MPPTKRFCLHPLHIRASVGRVDPSDRVHQSNRRPLCWNQEKNLQRVSIEKLFFFATDRGKYYSRT